MDKEIKKLPYVEKFGIKTIRYRIIETTRSAFQVQKWRVWFPFFWETISYNTFLANAIYIVEKDYERENFKSKVVMD